MNKFITFFLLSLLTLPAWSQSLQLEKFDQAKLGEVLDRLSTTVRRRVIVRKSWFSPDKKVKLTYPRVTGPFSMVCRRSFYGQSPVPSETECEVSIDLEHELVKIKNDVIRVIITNPADVEAWYDAIPYGMPKKKFYSYSRNTGTTYVGNKGTVYHYQILCSQEQCQFNFSKKILTD